MKTKLTSASGSSRSTWCSAEWSHLLEADLALIDRGKTSYRYAPGQIIYSTVDECAGIFSIGSSLVGLMRFDEIGNLTLPDEPEIEEPTRLRPEIPPLVPEGRLTLPQCCKPQHKLVFGPSVLSHGSSRRQFTLLLAGLALLILGPASASQTGGDVPQETTPPPIPVEQASPQAVLALKLPIERRTRIDHQQYGVTSIDHQEGGQFQAKTTFANGRRQEGGYFCAEIGVVGANDLLLVRIRQRAGVDVSIGWKPTKLIIKDSFNLNPAQAGQVESIDIAHYACRSIEASKIWRGAKALAGDIISDHGGDLFSQPQSHLPRERLGQF